MLLQFLSAAACAFAEDRKFRGGLQYGAWFGIFQALMPFLGYHLGLYFAAWVDAYAHWIIFLILSWIGIGMIKEAHEEVSCKVITGPLTMLGLAVATSIVRQASCWKLPLKGSAWTCSRRNWDNHLLFIFT